MVERHQRPSEVLKTLASQAANMNGERGREEERERGREEKRKRGREEEGKRGREEERDREGRRQWSL